MIYFLIAVGIWLVLVVSISCFKIYSPIWLSMRGDYESAIDRLDRLLSSKRLSKRIRGTCLYNKALCQHRTGMLKESNVTLDQVSADELDSNLEAAFHGLQGTNLLLQEEDLKSAKELLEQAYSVTRLSSYVPTLGYCELLLGNNVRADELIAGYLDKSRGRKNTSFGLLCFLVTDKVFSQASCPFFLGLYFLKKADLASAKSHFLVASNLDVANIYSEKATQMLQAI